jgi:hypothetical protein
MSTIRSQQNVGEQHVASYEKKEGSPTINVQEQSGRGKLWQFPSKTNKI